MAKLDFVDKPAHIPTGWNFEIEMNAKISYIGLFSFLNGPSGTSGNYEFSPDLAIPDSYPYVLFRFEEESDSFCSGRHICAVNFDVTHYYHADFLAPHISISTFQEAIPKSTTFILQPRYRGILNKDHRILLKGFVEEVLIKEGLKDGAVH